MSKRRIQGALYALVLCAVGAAFSSVANVESPNSRKLTVGPLGNSDNGILTADGGDPYPRPPMPPPPELAS